MDGKPPTDTETELDEMTPVDTQEGFTPHTDGNSNGLPPLDTDEGPSSSTDGNCSSSGITDGMPPVDTGARASLRTVANRRFNTMVDGITVNTDEVPSSRTDFSEGRLTSSMIRNISAPECTISTPVRAEDAQYDDNADIRPRANTDPSLTEDSFFQLPASLRIPRTLPEGSFARLKETFTEKISLLPWKRHTLPENARLPLSGWHEDIANIQLMYARRQNLAPKCFNQEVGAAEFADNLVRNAVIILDLHKDTLPELIDTILHKLLDETELPLSVDMARQELYTNDDVHMLANTVQSSGGTYTNGDYDYDQSWFCTFCNLPTLRKQHVGIARLLQPANLGRTSQDTLFIIVILSPIRERGSKTTLDVCRIFGSIFAYVEFRRLLLDADTEEKFREQLATLFDLVSYPYREHATRSTDLLKDICSHHAAFRQSIVQEQIVWVPYLAIGQGILSDADRRMRFYISDFKDGVTGKHTIHKLISTILFLYFSCLLPAIAFGVLNSSITDEKIGVYRVVLGQGVGGLLFSLFGGQPLLILVTTAPLTLYTKEVANVSKQHGVEFWDVFACVGIWNSVFLIIFALFNFSNFSIKYFTRSVQEVFGLFVSIAYAYYAISGIVNDFSINYFSPACLEQTNCSEVECCLNGCHRERSILYLFLTMGTLMLGLSVLNFTDTPFLNQQKREILADYALPIAVLVMAFIGSYAFYAVDLSHFNTPTTHVFVIANMKSLTLKTVLISAIIGFSLSLLFFVDQNTAAAIINSPPNRLKKGAALHYDLAVLSVLNALLSLFGLPWMHGSIAHASLHVRALADIEERVDQGHVYQIIVKVRETRLTGIISSTMIALSLLMIPYPLNYIDNAVLDGLFLYLAYSSISDTQLLQRIKLIFQEQCAYSPNHYLRRTPKRIVHAFTFMQLLQLAVIVVLGFSKQPFIKMLFPLFIFLMVPIRNKLLPKILSTKYLEIMDSEVHP